MKFHALVVAFSLMSAPALAETHVSGDAEAGEAVFNKQCVSCHVVLTDDGKTLAGRKARTGPNLYGVAGRTIGTYPDFRYGTSMSAAGEAGHVWNEENFVAYVQDPTGWLRETLGDSKARSKMSFKVREDADALNVYAFLAKIGPAMKTKPAADQPASN